MGKCRGAFRSSPSNNYLPDFDTGFGISKVTGQLIEFG